MSVKQVGSNSTGKASKKKRKGKLMVVLVILFFILIALGVFGGYIVFQYQQNNSVSRVPTVKSGSQPVDSDLTNDLSDHSLSIQKITYAYSYYGTFGDLIMSVYLIVDNSGDQIKEIKASDFYLYGQTDNNKNIKFTPFLVFSANDDLAVGTDPKETIEKIPAKSSKKFRLDFDGDGGDINKLAYIHQLKYSGQYGSHSVSISIPKPLFNDSGDNSTQSASPTGVVGMTQANFDSIDSSYTVNEVNALFGIEGTLTSEAGQGTDYDLESYEWTDPVTNAIATVMFQNGRETAKDSVGLNY
ncbi:hypothetical protein [Alicyclobacillus fodiniaquatilis]|uniref:DUF5067 domain-containing protein n=1 Tax=Alicyclobacillus fodiniaquatilis TaxID=1661150 RepID=A0ABW4JHW7_9BACL